MARSQLSAQPALCCTSGLDALRKKEQRGSILVPEQRLNRVDLVAKDDVALKEQRLNRVDLGAKDDVALTFAAIAYEPARVLGPLSAPHFEHTITNKHKESG